MTDRKTIKLSNELTDNEVDQGLRAPKPNRFRQAVDVTKTVGMGLAGAGAAAVSALKSLKPRQDIKTLQ